MTLSLRAATRAQRIVLMIDGPNFYASIKSLEIDVNYKAVLNKFRLQGHVVDAIYYTAVDESKDHIAIKPTLDWLEFNGFTLRQKPTKSFFLNGEMKIKGNMDVEIAVDALRLASHVDHLVLFSGDGDFRYLVQAVKEMGVMVTVVSTLGDRENHVQRMCADELRRVANVFIDLKEIRDEISRSR